MAAGLLKDSQDAFTKKKKQKDATAKAAELERIIGRLHIENDILKQAMTLLEENLHQYRKEKERNTMIGIIEYLLPHYSKRLLCRTLNFNRSSFYDHKKRVDAAEKKSDVEVIDALKAIALKRPYYGYRRITHQLKRQGFNVNHKYVYSIMRKEGLLCRRKRKTIKTTDSNHAKHIYPNLTPKVKVTNINQLWVSDITYIKLEKGFAYFAHIMDTFSRKCIGWDVDVRIDSQLCLNALNMALKNREGAKHEQAHSPF